MNCPVLFPFVLVAEFSSFAIVTALVYASFISLHVFAHLNFDPLLPSPCPWPAALLSNCSQGLANQLRLNKILTSINMANHLMCDEKVKAPAGQTSASLAEGAGVGRGRPGFSWGARCLTMPLACQLTIQVVQHGCCETRSQFTMISLSSLPCASCQLCRSSPTPFASTRA